MPLFYLKFTLLENARSDCMTLFGSMTEADDKKEMGEIRLIGRWSTLGEGAGFCICEAKNAQILGNWLVNWVPMVTITTVPILDDNMAREIILGKPPPYVVDYKNAGNEAKEGESLYFIEYTFKNGCKSQGFELFANLSEEEDKQDAGNNTCYGRWHNLGTGTGIAICSSKSEVDLYTWAFHWKDLCDVIINPVLNDSQFRNIVRSKPDYAKKHALLMEKINPTKSRNGWFR